MWTQSPPIALRFDNDPLPPEILAFLAFINELGREHFGRNYSMPLPVDQPRGPFNALNQRQRAWTDAIPVPRGNVVLPLEGRLKRPLDEHLNSLMPSPGLALAPTVLARIDEAGLSLGLDIYCCQGE